MDRRSAIKSILALGAVAVIPIPNVFSKGLNLANDKNLHIIGLGGGGCNALEYYYKQGVQAKFTCISEPRRPHLDSKISFIEYAQPKPFYYEDDWSNIELTIPSEVKSVFDADEHFIILLGLGGVSGTLLGKSLFHYLLIKNKSFDFICSYPFRNEGSKRVIQAKSAFKEFDKYGQFNAFRMENLRNESEDLTISEAFRKADEHSYKLFMSVI